MAKKKPTKQKFVIGGLKRHAKWKVGLLALVVLLLVTVIGYGGYGKYKEHSLKAHAAGWTIVYSAAFGRTTVYACKTNVSSIYGDLVSVSFLIGRGTSSPRYLEAASNSTYVNSANQVALTTNRQPYSYKWWGGTAMLLPPVLTPRSPYNGASVNLQSLSGVGAKYLYWTQAEIQRWADC
jgi:hypothetical protein